ncbi:hypothetical protein SEA_PAULODIABOLI_353 [Microbacterium phage PauloDiaboli]|nr:hypothetical protein SEA_PAULODIABOLI_353 [Microbacterium phage PauloDiaboli]
MIDDVLSAMGWSGNYPHCSCCSDGCKMYHYAPCVVPKHREDMELHRARERVAKTIGKLREVR